MRRRCEDDEHKSAEAEGGALRESLHKASNRKEFAQKCRAGGALGAMAMASNRYLGHRLKALIPGWRVLSWLSVATEILF